MLSSQGYEFEIQQHEDGGNRGDAALWTPVLRKLAISEEREGPVDLSPLVTATELSPSTSYRLRVRARHADGVSPTSDASEIFTTGERRDFGPACAIPLLS